MLAGTMRSDGIVSLDDASNLKATPGTRSLERNELRLNYWSTLLKAPPVQKMEIVIYLRLWSWCALAGLFPIYAFNVMGQRN